MTERATAERKKQVERLRTQHQEALDVRKFLLSERSIVLDLLEKDLGKADEERVDNLRARVQEKDRQLRLVEDEIREIEANLSRAEQRLKQALEQESSGSR